MNVIVGKVSKELVFLVIAIILMNAVITRWLMVVKARIEVILYESYNMSKIICYKMETKNPYKGDLEVLRRDIHGVDVMAIGCDANAHCIDLTGLIHSSRLHTKRESHI